MTEHQEANKALFGQLERDFEDPGVLKPRGWSLYPLWGGSIHFGRSIEESLGNHFQFIPEKAGKKPDARLGPPCALAL